MTRIDCFTKRPRWNGSKVFYFQDGSNPYIVWDLNEFFKMIVAWNPEMLDNDTFRCPKEPTTAYYNPVDYNFKKDALRSFAIEWQTRFGSGDFTSYWSDCAEWSEFFTIYGKKYGLMKEFKENGIC